MIVFTDLDGTLLGHHTYAFDAALPALKALQNRGIPLIIATSKTIPEVERLRRRLHNRHPYIVENGAALVIPQGYFSGGTDSESESEYESILLSSPYETLRAKLCQWRADHGFRFEGFGDWDASTISKHTELPLEDARLAGERVGSEPLLWHDSETALAQFRALLEKEGLRLIKGGRFDHVIGETNKARACRKLLKLYHTHQSVTPRVVALGDSPNDLEMLQLADDAVVIRRHDGSYMPYTGDNRVTHTEKIGPAGWNEALQEILGSGVVEIRG